MILSSLKDQNADTKTGWDDLKQAFNIKSQTQNKDQQVQTESKIKTKEEKQKLANKTYSKREQKGA